MDIKKAIKILNILLTQTDKKREKKLYNCFIRTLSSLDKRDLTENQIQLIQEKLSSFNLKEIKENRKRHYKQKLAEFKVFLKDEFSFTTEKYYTEQGMSYGMALGVGIGLSIGGSVDPTIGTSIGLSTGISVGMLLGMVYGAKKDAEAKKQGTVI